MNSFILPVLGYIGPLQLYCKVCFDIEWLTKAYMPLNKDTKPVW